ncbi:MAG: hypothetical protein KJS97_12600 [Alphaproteobacteria bacterium]|nr:hypothetical protein [Alphaproteobacteria bacterium]
MARQPTIEPLFVTQLYRADLSGAEIARLNADLARSCRAIAADDAAGQAWSAANGYAGYTSYASLNDLVWRDPDFAALAERIDPHVAAFAKACDFDLGGGGLELDSLWINVLEPGGMHSGHIHPHAVVSGTYYVDIPEGASALKFEDPRLPSMMAAPPRKARARREHRTHVAVEPRAGTLLLWESWLRHEVMRNMAATPRVSVSFNYAWRR